MPLHPSGKKATMQALKNYASSFSFLCIASFSADTIAGLFFRYRAPSQYQYFQSSLTAYRVSPFKNVSFTRRLTFFFASSMLLPLPLDYSGHPVIVAIGKSATDTADIVISPVEVSGLVKP